MIWTLLWDVVSFLAWLALGGMIFLFIAGALIVQAQIERITKAGEALYTATLWRSSMPNKLSLDEEARLWANFRDALELHPGTATAKGVGDPCAKGENLF